MDNFLLGLAGIALNIKNVLVLFVNNPIVLGFILGFSASTGIHAIVISEKAHYIPCILTKKAPDSYSCLVPKNKKGEYLVPYSSFLHEYNRVRVIFYLTFLVFLLLVVVAILQF